jgi:hypothetical protein
MNVLFNILASLNSGPEVPEVKPLTLRNVGTDPAVVYIELRLMPNVYFLQYRMEGEKSWKLYKDNAEITVNPNEAVQFQKKNTIWSNGGMDYGYFVIPDGTKFNAEGNIQSLLNYSNSVHYQCCFYKLFKQCDGLIDASQLILPSTKLTNSCYAWMFSQCTNLVNGPALPATTLATNCYLGMFEECPSLVNAPELPATYLTDRCYKNMFYNCPSLVNAPELPATTLATECYAQMFYGCTNLKEIKVHFTAYNNSALNDWVNGVSSTGTFYKQSALPLEYGLNRIPEGWTVINTNTGEVIEPPDSGNDDSSSSELKFTLAGSQYNGGVLNGEYVETEASKTARNGSFNNCTIRATKKDNSDYYIKIQIGDSSSDTFGTGITACYVEAPEGIVYEVSSMFGYILFEYMGSENQLSLTLTSNNSTLNNTAAFQALKTKFLNA